MTRTIHSLSVVVFCEERLVRDMPDGVGRGAKVEAAYIDSENVVFGWKELFAVKHLFQGWVGPVDDQTAGVDGPMNVIDLLRDVQVRVKTLLDVGDVDLEMGDK